jgi:hypothetical protein
MGKALTKMIQMGQSRPSGTLVDGYINVVDIRDRRLFAEAVVVFELADWRRRASES